MSNFEIGDLFYTPDFKIMAIIIGKNNNKSYLHFYKWLDNSTGFDAWWIDYVIQSRILSGKWKFQSRKVIT